MKEREIAGVGKWEKRRKYDLYFSLNETVLCSSCLYKQVNIECINITVHHYIFRVNLCKSVSEVFFRLILFFSCLSVRKLIWHRLWSVFCLLWCLSMPVATVKKVCLRFSSLFHLYRDFKLSYGYSCEWISQFLRWWR